MGDPLDESTQVGPLGLCGSAADRHGVPGPCDPRRWHIRYRWHAAEEPGRRLFRASNSHNWPPFLEQNPPGGGAWAGRFPAGRGRLRSAVAAANDTPFGLAAAVFTRDLRRALKFANDAQAGVAKVNQETA